MRVARYVITEVDQYIEEAQRAKRRLDFERGWAELRPRTMQLIASREARLTWSRTLLTAVVEERYRRPLVEIGWQPRSRPIAAPAARDRDRGDAPSQVGHGHPRETRATSACVPPDKRDRSRPTAKRSPTITPP